MESINVGIKQRPACPRSFARLSPFRTQTGARTFANRTPRNPDHGASDACGDDESRSSDTPMRPCKSSRKFCIAILIEAPMH